MKIQLLAEGSTKRDRLLENWGLSFLVGDDMLFDGYGKAAPVLAALEKLGVDAGMLKDIVVSHDDWDHIAALWPLLTKNPHINLHVCAGSDSLFIEKLRKSCTAVNLVEKAYTLRKGIISTGEMMGKDKERVIYEQALVITTESGATLLTGCAHPGIVALVDRAAEITGRKISTVIGGFHLKNSEPGEIMDVVEGFNKCHIETIVPLHCTGRDAVALFRRYFKGSCSTVCPVLV